MPKEPVPIVTPVGASEVRHAERGCRKELTATQKVPPPTHASFAAPAATWDAAEATRRRNGNITNDALLSLFELHLDAIVSALVFCHPETGKPLDRSKLVRRFKQALDRAEVHRITFHELRHTFGTRMAAAGTPMRTLQHWIGHADSKTTQIYAHYQPSDQEADAVDRGVLFVVP